MIRSLALAALLGAQLMAEFTQQEAMDEPFIIRFEAETQYKLKPYLEKALVNPHWQRANEIMYQETVARKWGKQELITADIQGAVEEFAIAGEKGIVLASWQGLNIAKALAPFKGDWYNSVVPRLAKQLVKENICQGYLDLAKYQARGWAGSRGDFRKAADTLAAGKEACNRTESPDWQKDRWAKEYYKYDALTRYPGVLKFTGRE